MATIGKFHNLATARHFRNHTIMASAIVLGDDDRYWVVTLAQMTKLQAAGYSVLPMNA